MPDGRVRLAELGGNAVYAAVGATMWSADVGLWSRIGQNYSSEWLSQLQAAGLDTSGVRRLSRPADHRTFYTYDARGRRTDTDPERHFAALGLPLPVALKGYSNSTPGQDDLSRFDLLALRPADLPTGFEAVSAVHLAPLPIRSHLSLTELLAERHTSWITLDPGERYMKPELAQTLRQMLRHVSAFIPSEQELRSLFGASLSTEEALQRLGQWGARLVVLKRGVHGVTIYQRTQDTMTHLPAYHVPGDARVVDPTGAGDAFCGGFIAGLVETNHPVIAAYRGLVSASLVVEGHGALYALQADEARARAQARLREMRSRRQ
ncbi:MAG: carbohydrate kinase family protein [Candidatus Promineifilaceae bacterium]|nr:carbohydrate kinase family protein [Candidatus Promineifilaceae bacterium]